MTVLAKVSKAVGAAIGGAAGAWVVANQVGGVTTEEWGGVLLAALIAFGGAFFAPKNKPA